MKKAPLADIALVLVATAAAATQSRWFERLIWGGPAPLHANVPAPPPGLVAAQANLKIAFVGDSGAGRGFQAVLALAAREQAQAVVHLGDAIYDESPAQFWAAVDGVLGHDFPYFLAQGNHDLHRWPELAEHAHQHRGPGAVLSGTASEIDPRFSLVWRGLSLVFLGQQARDDDPRYIVDRLSRDQHIWKICSWHKNQHELQVGGKGDEMGWGVYESCRQMGALIQNGHEHSYHRTKTLASTVEQRVDPTCNQPGRLCARPGAVPVFVSGLGGRSIREQKRCLPARYPYGCKGEWAFVFTKNQAANYGALFIAFHVDGDPRKAHGYFKTVDDRTVDAFDLHAR